MSAFDPKFIHDVLLVMAEAGYLQTLNPATDLPSGYTAIGKITADAPTVTNVMSTAAVQHQALLTALALPGPGFGWVAQNVAEGIAIATFRGTQSVDDWLHNFDIILSPYQSVANFGMVHSGFQLYYQTIRKSLFSLLSQIDPRCTRLILTGHSLGAALSELAAPDVLHNFSGPWAPEVQNFAGPRVGAPDFANVFDAQIDVCFRVVNIWDIVPNLPPPLIFEHVGMAVTIDGGFTLDELQAHSLEESYGPGLLKLIPAAVPGTMGSMSVPVAALSFPNVALIGRVR